eukprot:TRINITY_DN40322_c0_g1_i1.p1 TRINITY_DN40322_c0_g1~~TRINITY_DN40322_c0_g1_i1.p1  ORF type:complete len:386 (-),score=104.13 TRINITY_DN40322_c0_g1_i1:72-1229(-)
MAPVSMKVGLMAWAVLHVRAAAEAMSLLGRVLKSENPTLPQVVLPKVPQIWNPGPDGYPVLPAVSELSGDFTQANADLDEESNGLAKHFKEVISKSNGELSALKQELDGKLKLQEQENQKIVKENAALASKIVALTKSSKKLKQELSDEASLIEARRDEYQRLEKHFYEGQKMLHDALATSDLSKEFATLGLNKEQKSNGTDDNKPLSFLQKPDGSHLKRHGLKVSKKFLHAADKLEPQASSSSGVIWQESLAKTAGSAGVSVEEEEELTADEKKELELLEVDIRKMRRSKKLGEAKIRQTFVDSLAAGKARQQALLHTQEALKKFLAQEEVYYYELVAKRARFRQTFEALKASVEKESSTLSNVAGGVQKVLSPVPSSVADGTH